MFTFKSPSPPRLLVGSIVTFALLLFSSCSKDANSIGDKSTFATHVAMLRDGNPLVTFSYEIETKSRYQTKSIHGLDAVFKTPLVTRQKVTMQLFANGSTQWVMENLAPESPVIIPHETLPDDMPKIAKTVISNGQTSMYDAAGNLMGTQDIEPITFTELADTIAHVGAQRGEAYLNQAFANVLAGQATNSFEDMILHASDLGITVGTVEGGITSLVIPITEGEFVGGENIMLIDRTNNLLLGSSMFGASGSVLSSVYYAFEPAGNGWKMASFRTFKPVKMPSGADGTVETENHLSNQQCTFSL